MALASSLRGKVAIITGSSSGIGGATAELFSKLGASVVITGRSAEKLEAVKQLCIQAGGNDKTILGVAADVTNTEQMRSLVEQAVGKFGRVDVLVNNAGAASTDGSASCSIDDSLDLYDHVMNVNARSVVALTQLVLPHLKKTKGVIVNVSSVGSFRPIPVFVYYQMAKSAIDQFTRNLAVQLGPEGIRVNAVNPGYIKSNFATRTDLPQQFVTAYEAGIVSVCPLKRVGHPDDIAKTIAFLSSDAASYTTGQLVVCDGGISISSQRDTSGGKQ